MVFIFMKLPSVFAALSESICINSTAILFWLSGLNRSVLISIMARRRIKIPALEISMIVIINPFRDSCLEAVLEPAQSLRDMDVPSFA